MKIGLGLTFDTDDTHLQQMADFSLRLAGRLRIAFGDILSLPLESLITTIRASQAQISGFNFAPPSHDPAWIYGDSCVAGAMVLADDVQRLQCLGNELDPPFQPPCHGIVPLGSPICVESKPIGHVVSIGPDHNIYSSKFVDFLRSFAQFQVRGVFLHEKGLPDWHRIVMDAQGDILSLSTLHHYNCLSCGSDRVGYKGVLVGEYDVESRVCVSACSIGHSAHSESLLVSPELCRRLEDRFRDGFGLRPIVNEFSDEGKRIVEIIGGLRSLGVTPQ